MRCVGPTLVYYRHYLQYWKPLENIWRSSKVEGEGEGDCCYKVVTDANQLVPSLDSIRRRLPRWEVDYFHIVKILHTQVVLAIDVERLDLSD